MEKECICCGQKRRVDRMSMHLLEKHRDAIIATSSNKNLLDECIKSRNGYVRVVLKTATGTDDYWVSFAYNSGWNAKPKMHKILEKIKENRDAHLEVCKALLADIIKFQREKKDAAIENIVATGDVEKVKNMSSAYDDLLAKYKAMEKKKNTIEASNDRLRTRMRVREDAMNALFKFYDIDHLLYSCIEAEVGTIWEAYPECPTDDTRDEENEEQRRKLIEAISLEEMKRDAAHSN